jgi:hypothetical protein
MSIEWTNWSVLYARNQTEWHKVQVEIWSCVTGGIVTWSRCLPVAMLVEY